MGPKCDGVEGQAGPLLRVSVPELFLQAQHALRTGKATLFLERDC